MNLPAAIAERTCFPQVRTLVFKEVSHLTPRHPVLTLLLSGLFCIAGGFPNLGLQLFFFFEVWSWFFSAPP